MSTGWPFAPLLPLKYGMIVCDPPWSFENWSAKGEAKNAKAHYDCMPLDALKALPVGHLAAGDCCLFLWATWPMLPEAMDLMRAWGFDYRTGGAWHKKTSGGKTAFGTGYRVRCACEPFLLGFIGNPSNSRSQRNLIEGVTREHSRKPDEAYRWAEAYMPDAWRVELFSRQARPGWDAWGNESGKFAAEAA
jgi:N6-adenosine-specific RNA methylase IME4